MTSMARSTKESAGPAARRGGRAGVLVVDDSVVYRTGMVRAIRACDGLELLGEADNGEVALRLIDELEPDLVILDLRMPVLDGIGVLQRLHAGDTPPKCRVLVISATLDDGGEDAALAAGADACLSKGTSRSEICAAAMALADR
jgi:DNA-binding NarL/FixJ family response regulator